MAGVVVIAYVGIGVALTLLQDRMIFLPTQDVPPIADVLLDAEEITVRTADGLDLAMWYLPPPAGADACPAPAVVLFHGTGGNRAWLAMLGVQLRRAGMAVLLADYRGYGGNPGRPTDDGLALDAEAARSHLAGRPEIDTTRIAYHGDSLGTGVATRLAVDHPPAAMVLRSPYTSIADVAATRVPVYPTDFLVHEQFRTIDRIGAIEAPVLVAVADDDQLIPIEQSRAVFDAARGPKEWSVRAGASHEDPAWSSAPDWAGTVVAFLREPLALGRCPG